MKNSPLNIGIVGAGSWGTALATLLAYNDHKVTLWVYENEVLEHLLTNQENHFYLPGFLIPDSIFPTQSFAEVSQKKDLVVCAVPSHLVRKVLSKCVPFLDPQTILVSVSKGIENDTLMTISDIFKKILPKNLFSRSAFLSGPSFAKEVAHQHPTAVVVAAEDHEVAQKAQKAFAAPFFRVYTSNDVRGVELGGALKNVIAIAAGCSDGLNFGDNTRAAIITRGLAEISRLGVALGANPLTIAGLSGLGDLVLTCTGALSRNRKVGIQLGQGMSLDHIIKSSKMIAEGIKTAKSVYRLAKRHKVEMPIVEQVYRILYQNKDPRKAVSDLMGRSLRYELDTCL
ncbi:MAG: NAD(P)-dependent glycerol-3-phosphate dehydrogenase [Thermodesulfobacteriota bacterium]|jgi:glycerol-3-phosphate dehydrogenase (NAD(P)+)|nr:MAG: NAD(P)-dependent glycerol-3-phosphate dehydrogenase [Thermodesulfobacteriota bacterium]